LFVKLEENTSLVAKRATFTIREARGECANFAKWMKAKFESYLVLSSRTQNLLLRVLQFNI